MTWRVSERGTKAHIELGGGDTACGTVEPGPWRVVSGADHCQECEDLKLVESTVSTPFTEDDQARNSN